MPSNYGIAISIVCDGAFVEEYATQAVDERTVSCFVPSASGKTFEILLTNNLNLQDVSVSIAVDGNPIGRYFLAPGQKMLPGLYVSETLTKPFRFRNLVFNDEQGIHDPRFYTWENTGSIDFSIYRCSKTGIAQFRPQDPSGIHHPSATAGEASRRSRAGTPSIETGNEVPIKAIHGVGGVTIDPLDKPYAKIIIRYRPREILQMQGVVPSSSSRPSTASSTAVSHTARKRSLESVSGLLSESGMRPSQKLRGSSPTENLPSPGSVRSSHGTHSRSNSQTWAPQPALNLLGTGTLEELAHMKTQLRQATDQMNGAMRQMRASMELMNRSMRQMQFLQQRITALEARQQQQQQHHLSSSATLPPLQLTHDPSPPPTTAAPSEHMEEAQLGAGAAEVFAPFEESAESWAQGEEIFNTDLPELQWPS